ncbi:1-acyl-sn-glycerol-3-phosphate acyltransferase [Natronospira sp.]|uniref:1-acyl-sn-glycerol-3-phosphate acyltransferase n=1 Tax=Natronospira sp. TaxID=2024970 RepID=UPI003872BE02
MNNRENRLTLFPLRPERPSNGPEQSATALTTLMDRLRHCHTSHSLRNTLGKQLALGLPPFLLTATQEGILPFRWHWDGEWLWEQLGQQESPAPAHGMALSTTWTPVPAPGQGAAPPGDIPEKCFDVEALFRDKAPALHGKLPRLLWPLLARLLCQSTINEGLSELAALPCRHFPETVLTRLGVSARLPVHPLPAAETRPIFVCNHPQGGLDGLIMLAWLLRWYPHVKVPVNNVLMGFRHLQPFLAPLNRYASERDMSRVLHESFADDAAMLVFPAGRTSRKQGGQLRDGPWGKMVVRMARQHGRSIVPVFLGTRNSRRFNAVSALRRGLGLGMNLEMLLLPREMLYRAPRNNDFFVGAPLQADRLTTLGDDDRARAAALRTLCYQMASDMGGAL